MNNQPMGFYPIEAIKQDARRFGVRFHNPCVNLSESRCIIKADSLLIGIDFVKNVGRKVAQVIMDEREKYGTFLSVGDFVRRLSLTSDTLESLIMSGAFDSLSSNRRVALWESGIYPSPLKSQRPLPMDMKDSIPDFLDFTDYQKMRGEYQAMSMYPSGHIMQFFRNSLSEDVFRISSVDSLPEGHKVAVGGCAIARQHPRGRNGTVFITIEDESSDVQLILWPHIFNLFKHELREPLFVAHGEISRWDGTTNVIVNDIEIIETDVNLPLGHDWR